MLRMGPNKQLIQDTQGNQKVIKTKDSIKGLGIMADTSLRYKDQIQKAIGKANKKAGWVLRTFSTRKTVFMRKMWKSLIQCHLDYGSVLWAPVDRRGDLMALEKPLRAFTRKALGLSNQNYWESLQSFKMYSNQRRNERYKVIYIWKSLQGLVPSLGLELRESGTRLGPLIDIDRLSGSCAVRSLQSCGIRNFGARLFNSLPVELKYFNGTAATFKMKLDKFLSNYPDNPQTEDLTPDATDWEGGPSNCLIDWIRKMGLPPEEV